MTQSASQKVISEFIARCDARMGGRGGADPYALLAPNAVVTVNGTTPVSGRFPGLEIVKGILVDTVEERMSKINVSVEEFVGHGERVATLLKITGRTRQGKTYNEKGEVCGCVFEVKDGRIVSGWEYFFDLYAWDEFWA